MDLGALSCLEGAGHSTPVSAQMLPRVNIPDLPQGCGLRLLGECDAQSAQERST